VKAHHDGCVTLPAVSRELGLAAGAELTSELVGGVVVLRPDRRLPDPIRRAATREDPAALPRRACAPPLWLSRPWRGKARRMHKLLEQAVAEAAALPEDQQEAVAARLLEEVRRRAPNEGRWARVAGRLTRLDAFKGRSAAFERHARAFRDGFRLRDLPPG
jgi:hypothetical protein